MYGLYGIRCVYLHTHTLTHVVHNVVTMVVQKKWNKFGAAVNATCHFGHARHSFVSPGLVTILLLDLSLYSGAPKLFLPVFRFHLGHAKCLNGMRSCPSVSLPAIAQAVIRRRLNSETRIHFRTTACGIYDGQTGTGTCLSSSSSVLSLSLSLNQRSTFNFQWSHTQCSSSGHHVALEPNWCVSCKLPIQNDVQVFHMHTRLTWTAICKIFRRNENHNMCTCIYCAFCIFSFMCICYYLLLV